MDRIPSHLHIDLLPRVQGQGHGRFMVKRLLAMLRERRSPGVHLGMTGLNSQAYGFYRALGFAELARRGGGLDETVYLGMVINEIDG